MTILWIFTTLFLLLAIAILWRHFFKTKLYSADQGNMRGQTNKELYYEHLKELQKDFDEGGIDEENFTYLKEELDRSLLLDMTATAKEETALDKKTSLLWPSVMTLFIIAFSAIFYQQSGAYTDVEIAASQPKNHPQGEQSQAQVIIAQLQTLHEEVKKNPNNSNAWFKLGQLLTNVGEFDSAYIAFGKVNEIEGEQADVIALQAQARYYKNNQKFTPEIEELLEKALLIDANDPTTLMLIGMDHYINLRYALAADTWQKIIDNSDAGENSGPLLEGIDEARRLASEQSGTEVIANQSKPSTQADSALSLGQSGNSTTNSTTNLTTDATKNMSGDAVSIKVNVGLSETIISELQKGSDKTLFIYAIASNGPRMPLAAVKARASDLPISVTLDDTKAMSPQMTISSADQVNIIAVISHAGTPGAKPGDFRGEVANVDVKSTVELNLTIDSIVQ